jgi:hypothetical protein
MRITLVLCDLTDPSDASGDRIGDRVGDRAGERDGWLDRQPPSAS